MNRSSSPPEDARSPDHTIAAQTFFCAKSWRYSLPVNRRPLSTSGCMSAATLLRSSSVTVSGSALRPSLSSPRPNVSRASVRNVTLSDGMVHRSATLVGSGDVVLGQRLGVVADARHARLPRVVVVLGRIPRVVLEAVLEVRDGVRDVRLVDLLGPARGDDLRGHPVGEDHQVPAGRQAADERRLDRLDERCVVADLLLVVDLDAVLGLELLQGRGGAGGVLVGIAEVDVRRPVGEHQRAGGGRGALDAAADSDAPSDGALPRTRRRSAPRSSGCRCRRR